MVGLPKMIIQQQYVRGIRGGLAITAADVGSSPAVLPAGNRTYVLGI